MNGVVAAHCVLKVCEGRLALTRARLNGADKSDVESIQAELKKAQDIVDMVLTALEAEEWKCSTS